MSGKHILALVIALVVTGVLMNVGKKLASNMGN